MAAKKGNKYNEKWTKEKVEKLLERALYYAKDGYTSFTDIALQLDLLPDNFNYIIMKFEVFRSIKKELMEIVKNNLISKALKNEVNTTMAIFVLKCNYNMIPVEKIEQKNTIRNVDISAKEAQEIARKLDEKLDI